MYIQIEETPNPNTIKFIIGKDILGGNRPIMLASPEEAENQSTLASAIFTVSNVASVFIGSNFVSVSKTPDSIWDNLKPSVLAIMLEHFNLNRPVLAHTQKTSRSDTKEFFDPKDKSKVKEIKTLIEERIRPIVAQDGGDIVFRGLEKGIVYLHMQGACAGCPSASLTLKSGIENMLKYYIEDITEVREII